MSRLNGKEVLYAVAHGTIKVPDAAQVGPTLSSKAGASNPAVKMTIVDEDIRLELTNVSSKKKTVIYVPKTNFSHFQVVDETNN